MLLASDVWKNVWAGGKNPYGVTISIYVCEVEIMTKKQPDKRYLPCCSVRLVKDGTLIADRNAIRTPEDVSRVMEPYFAELPCEHFVVILLNTKNKVLAVTTVSVGSLNASIVHPRELFQRAILANAASVVLVHNHPSGDPTPSPEDISLTKVLVEAGRLLDIAVLDHVIIGDGRFVSFKEIGVLTV